MGIDVGGDLGLQRSREHRPCTVTHDLVEQRPARRAVIAGHIRVVDYLEHAAYLPEPARHRRLLIRTTWTFRSSSRRCAHPRHQAEDAPTGSDHCSCFARHRLCGVDRPPSADCPAPLALTGAPITIPNG